MLIDLDRDEEFFKDSTYLGGDGESKFTSVLDLFEVGGLVCIP
jgi:hypothetical protein